MSSVNMSNLINLRFHDYCMNQVPSTGDTSRLFYVFIFFFFCISFPSKLENKFGDLFLLLKLHKLL